MGGRCTWRDYAAQGKGLLDHLGIGRAHLMGGCAGCSVATVFAVAYPAAAASMVLYSPSGGARYRIRQHARFAQHLAFVAERDLSSVAALAKAGPDSFTQDPRVGPWVTVIRSDAAFAKEYAGQDAGRYATIVAGMARLLFDRDTVPGPEPEDLLAAQRPPLLQAAVLWLQAAYRTEALTTAWSDGRPGQALPVATMVTMSQSAPSTLSATMEMIFARRLEMTSIAGPASRDAIWPKAANIDFSPGSAFCRACSIWSRTCCWRSGRLMYFSGASLAPVATPSGHSSPAEAARTSPDGCRHQLCHAPGDRAIPPGARPARADH